MHERTAEEQRLDIEVATRLMGFRWVEWGPGAEGPLREPGRFLAESESPLAHVQCPADADAPRHERPLARVPRYSADVGHAFMAAEAASLFEAGKAVLFKGANDQWIVEIRGLQLTSNYLPELLCRAALARASATASE